MGKLGWEVSRLLLLQTGFMAGLKLEERFKIRLLVLVPTMRFCPVGLFHIGNESGWEQSSSNFLKQCL